MKRFVVVIAFALCACFSSPTAHLVPLPPQEPTELQWRSVMPGLIARADGIAVATITKLDEDWLYDDPCGIIMSATHQCNGTVTYRVHLMPIDKDIWAFTPIYGDFGLFPGERAVFIWDKVYTYEYGICRAKQGMTSTYCPEDQLPALTSDLDVLPVADSARVDSLRHIRRP